MEKPEKKPFWANDEVLDPVSGQSNKSEPPARTETEGWLRREIPPRQWFNWVLNKIGLWIDFLDEEKLSSQDVGGLLKSQNLKLLALRRQGDDAEYFDTFNGVEKESFNTPVQSSDLNDCAFDPKTNFIFFATRSGTANLLKSGPIFTGETESFVLANAAFSVCVDNESFVYAGFRNGQVRKLDSKLDQVWLYDPSLSVGTEGLSICVDTEKFVYAGFSNSNDIIKLDPDGNLVWTFSGHSDIVTGLCVDKEFNVYSCSDDSTTRKIDPEGNQIWLDEEPSGEGCTKIVNDKNFLYVGTRDGRIRKLDLDGDFQLEVGLTLGSDTTAVEVDPLGFFYGANSSSGSDSAASLEKFSPSGERVWRNNSINSRILSLILSSGKYGAGHWDL